MTARPGDQQKRDPLIRYTILYPVNTLGIGGAAQHLLELVRGLDKETFQPIVAPLYPGGGLEAEFRAVPGLEIIDLNRRGKYDPSPLWKVTRLLQRRRIDIVQPFLSPATFFGLLPALTCDSTTIIVTERRGVRQSRGVGYTTCRTIEDWCSRLADAIVPNSIAGEQMLIDRGLPQSKIRVIYNGINLERPAIDPEATASYRARLSGNKDVFVAGMLASLTPVKGHATTIRAIAELRDRQPQVHLAIVGDGPLRSQLEALITELGLSDQVTFLGYRRDVADLLTTFDVLISTSRDHEDCSNSILEAMALGVPVIATNCGDNRELVQPGETGRLVSPDDPTALANAISHTIDEPEQTRTMAAHARGRINSQFSLERMIRDYDDLYKQLLWRAVEIVDADGRLVALKT